MELIADQMKLEDTLERTINSDMEINQKVKNIKHILNELTSLEASIKKFAMLTGSSENNNENNNNTTNQN